MASVGQRNHEGFGNEAEGAAETAHAPRKVPRGYAPAMKVCGEQPDPSPAFAVEISSDLRCAAVRAGNASLELPVSVWGEVFAIIQERVGGDQLVAATAVSAAVSSATGPTGFGPRPGRHGADWSERETAALAKAYESGVTIAALALLHQRTTGSIEAQLEKIGLVAQADRQYGGRRTPSSGAPHRR